MTNSHSSETNVLPLIVEPEQLVEHLGDPQLLIVDVPLNGDSYRQGTCPAPFTSTTAI